MSKPLFWYLQSDKYHSDGCFGLSGKTGKLSEDRRKFIHDLLDDWIDSFEKGEIRALPKGWASGLEEPYDTFQLYLCDSHGSKIK